MVDTYLTSFQLFGKQEKEKVCIVVNGEVMDLSAPISLNVAVGDFKSLWIYTTPYQACGTFPPSESPSIPDDNDQTSNIGMFVMFQSGLFWYYSYGQVASYRGETIVDFWVVYSTEELSLTYDNPNDNIKKRAVPPLYPPRQTLLNSRKVNGVQRYLMSNRDQGYRMTFSFNGNPYVYCNQNGCDFPAGVELTSIAFQTESEHEIDRRPYW